ncbi:MAG: hypothetical protein HQK88_10180 [Nitrospirae bacterium]|nr:hypothetical protein [Nitrospirota bacterium]MBF0534983.1 hypothetical protein [Nitrospirota bacterium]MBF0617165.1 hypothetical protein [Nitrospirota bacterium]
MKKLLTVLLGIVLFGCVEVRVEKYTPVQEDLTSLTQKVEGYYSGKIPNNFSEVEYKRALQELCPTCTSVANILNNYKLKARIVNYDVITVMLCDKQSNNKVMEDFSCNNNMVEVRTWEKEKPESCEFETDWKAVIDTYCKQ